MGEDGVRRRPEVISHVSRGAKPMTTKRAFKVGPKWVLVLMALWGFAMIVPAALPH